LHAENYYIFMISKFISFGSNIK